MSMTTSGWQLRRIQGPEVEPITLALARAQCKIDPDITGDDELIETIYIPAAREQVEGRCKITLCESTWRYTLREFPTAAIELPRGPVIEVVSVSYLNGAGARVPYEDYQQSIDTMPASIFPAEASCWPFAMCGSGSVVIEYRAGYAGLGSPPGAESVPAAIKRTMLGLVSFWYETRDTKQLPDDWDAELSQFIVYP